MISKKAQVSIVILVIGVFAVCSFTLISFLSSSSYLRNSFTGVFLISKMNSEIEKYFVNPELVHVSYNSQGQKILYSEKMQKDKRFFGKRKLLFSVQYVLG